MSDFETLTYKETPFAVALQNGDAAGLIGVEVFPDAEDVQSDISEQVPTHPAISEASAAAKLRLQTAEEIAAERTGELVDSTNGRVSPNGIVFRTNVSSVYRNLESHKGSSEANDYFLVKCKNNPERLPAHLREFYGIQIEEVQL